MGPPWSFSYRFRSRRRARSRKAEKGFDRVGESLAIMKERKREKETGVILGSCIFKRDRSGRISQIVRIDLLSIESIAIIILCSRKHRSLSKRFFTAKGHVLIYLFVSANSLVAIFGDFSAARTTVLLSSSRACISNSTFGFATDAERFARKILPVGECIVH